MSRSAWPSAIWQAAYQLLVHPDVPFHPASTIKLGVMMEVFHQAAQGAFSLDDLLPVKNSFLSIADQSEFCLVARG